MQKEDLQEIILLHLKLSLIKYLEPKLGQMPEIQDILDIINERLSRIEKALDIVPDKFTNIKNFQSSIIQYEKFARDTLNIGKDTIDNHKNTITKFLEFSKGKINPDTVKSYLDSNESASWKSNQLKALRRYTRDYLKLGKWIESFNFKKTKIAIKNIPNDSQLVSFYNELPEQTQVIFLMLLSSGLRLNEIMTLKIKDVNEDIQMVNVSNAHKGQTKNSWISFVTEHTLDHYVDFLISEGKLDKDKELQVFSISNRSVQDAFARVSEKTGISINPHLLRTVFTEKCTQVGIPEKYINAFCSRAPQSVIAKNYTAYSHENLKRYYNKVESLLTLKLD